MTSQKLKILMLNYEFPPLGGGAANANLNLLKEFAGNDSISIDMLTCSASPGLTEEKFADNITIYKVGIRKKNLHLWKRTEVIAWLFKAYSYHRKMVSENDYDLAHAFFGFPTGFLPWLTAKKLPYIISLRGSDVPGVNARLGLEYKILGPLFRSIWKNSQLLVACSNGLRERAMRFMPHADYRVIPNGVDAASFNTERSFSLNEPLRLLTVGRLSSTKRFDVLIDTVELLATRGVDVRLTIAGGGALQDTLSQMITSKAIGDKISLIGRVELDQMPGIYKTADIFLSASIQEGMSNAMLEAMAAGLPMIVARCEGVEELITDNGIVLEEPSSKAFADSIQKLASHQQNYKAMSDAAFANTTGFTWTSAAEQYLQLYRSAVTRKVDA